jgi:hypothetical protein
MNHIGIIIVPFISMMHQKGNWVYNVTLLKLLYYTFFIRDKMMKTLVVATLLFGLLEAAKSSDKKCKKSVSNFKKCLKSGYQPKTLKGCDSGEGTLAKKRIKKCGKLERNVISKCDFTCAGEQFKRRKCNSLAF